MDRNEARRLAILAEEVVKDTNVVSVNLQNKGDVADAIAGLYAQTHKLAEIVARMLDAEARA